MKHEQNLGEQVQRIRKNTCFAGAEICSVTVLGEGMRMVVKVLWEMSLLPKYILLASGELFLVPETPWLFIPISTKPLCYCSLFLFLRSYSRERVEIIIIKKKQEKKVILASIPHIPAWGAMKPLGAGSSNVLPGASKSKVHEGEVLCIFWHLPSCMNKVKLIVNT